MSEPPEYLNTSGPVEIFDERIRDDNYTLNEIKRLLTGDATRKATFVNQAQQPDGDYVENKATGVVDSFTGSLNVQESYESEWFDTDGFGSIQIFISADAASSPQGLQVEFTDDVQAETPEVQATQNFQYTQEAVDRGFEDYSLEPLLDGFRLRYTNNGDMATDVTIITTLRDELSLDGADYVSQNTLGERFVRIGTSGEQEGIKIGEPSSLFGDLTTITRETILDLTSSFGTSTLRDEINTTGSATVSQDPADSGEIELSTGTTPDSFIELRTAEYGRYTPGFSAQAGVGIRFTSLPTEGEARWGYFDADDGFYWGYDGDQQELFVARRADGTEVQRVYQSDFNGFNYGDIFDKDFDLTDGYIYQIDFSWYGYGIVNFQVVSQTTDTISGRTPRQETINLHSIVVEGDTSVSDPNQPIEVELENGANGDDNTIRVGGRQFSVFGQPPGDERVTAETNENTTVGADAWDHIMSWRRANGAIDQNSRIFFNNLDFGIDQTSRLALVVNADITDLNYQTPRLTDIDETLLEVSTAGTYNGIGDGTKAWEGSVRVSGTGQAQASISPDVNLSVGQVNVISLIGYGVGGSGTGISTTRFTEDW